ncbi:MAG: hypothetical protein H8D23_31235 [Candidatus Brocadiales bacterium]|nr:hypothetical protein [Candidatus Brocadiales bacterium]
MSIGTMKKMFSVKSKSSKQLSAAVQEFYANGGVVTKVKRKKVKVSQRTGPAYIGGIARTKVGQNDVFRQGSTALA